MSAAVPDPVRLRLRRRLLVAALVPTVLGAAHHLDHVLRWYVGWPLVETVDPFTFSLLVYPVVLPGLYLTLRGRLLPGYWLAVAVVGLLAVAPVHLGPEAGDSIPAIYAHYDNPLAGALAVAILVGLMLSLVALAVTAVQARRTLGHW